MYTRSRTFERDLPINDNIKTANSQMSTEAVIGLVGVVVAVLGIALPLVWMKWRRWVGGARRAPSTEIGTALPTCRL